MTCDAIGPLTGVAPPVSPISDILINLLACWLMNPLDWRHSGGLIWDRDPMADDLRRPASKEMTRCGDCTDLSGEG